MCIDFDKGTGCGYWKFDTFNSTAADPGWTEVSWLIDGPYAPPGYPSLVQIGQVYFTGWSSDPAAGIDSTFVFGPAIDNFRIIAFVPEPSSLALLGIALAAFGARWRRSALRQLA
jgi:hypothetical protein